MIYLKKFGLLTGDECLDCDLLDIIENGKKDKRVASSSDELYPAFALGKIELNRIDFEDITILYGGNGSGKTTLLNIIAEKLGVPRKKKYLRTDFFDGYLSEYCRFEATRDYQRIKYNSQYLASDDVFDHILETRTNNKKLKIDKTDEENFFEKVNSPGGYETIYPNGVRINMDNPDDIENIRRFINAQKRSRRQYTKLQIGEMERQYSNGENAVMFFEKEIGHDAIYLLDEPENSLSPVFQLQVKQVIEDAVKYDNCQFIIATHSPFMLSLKNAKIYNLDTYPVSVDHWYRLENMRHYYELFKNYQDQFEKGF